MPASCVCGHVTLQAIGTPILSLVCYCESCRSAARQFEQAPGAPSVLNGYGGVDYCLYRKDRVRIVGGAEHLRDHRLTEASPTRRVIAACCNTPMFLEFTKGHWLSLYRDRFPQGAPPLEMGVMAKELPPGSTPAENLPTYRTRPPRFMIKLLTSWAAMGFRKSKMNR